MKGLPVIFFKTFIISIIVAIAVNCIYYAIVMRSAAVNYGQVVPLIIERTFVLNIIIAIMSLPMLFLYHVNYWNSIAGRLLLYFSGPVLFLIAIFYVGISPTSKAADLLTGLVYLIVNSIFYYRLTRKNKQASNSYRTRK